MGSRLNVEKAVYTRVASSEKWTESSHESLQQSKTFRTSTIAACILTLLVSSTASFFAGRYTGGERANEFPLSPIPNIPTTAVTFQADPKYVGPSSKDSDLAWASLVSPGEGFILIETPEMYNLNPGKQTPQGSLYDLSVYHQLHFLTKIREHLALLRFAYEQNNTSAWEKLVNPQAEHMYHCFDYLRQGIMCAGDMTLEWPKEGSKGVVDGWGVTHQCRDWEAIEKFVEEKRVFFPTLRR